jgi:glutamyl-tRNA reductase
MNLNVIGLNHKTAPLELREKFFFQTDLLTEALVELKKTFETEVVILSTCNRTEIYFTSSKINQMLQWLGNYHQISVSTIKKNTYHHKDLNAVAHAYRVASGIDSMILGETQILGQIKQASKVAEYAGTQGKILSYLFQKTFETAKKVRSETHIGASSTTIASCIFRLTKKIFGNIGNTNILFVGAGEMNELCAKYFSNQGPKKIAIANRSIEKAKKLATEINAEAILLGDIYHKIYQYDIIISCTGSQLPIIGLGLIEKSIKLRKHKPMLLVDLALPRDIEAEISELDDIFFYTLDNLAQMAQDGMKNRKGAIKNAENIIKKYVDEYHNKINQKKINPSIKLLTEQFEDSRTKELLKAQKELKLGKPIDEVLNKFSKNLSRKFLHLPTKALKKSAIESNHEAMNFIKNMYDLKD